VTTATTNGNGDNDNGDDTDGDNDRPTLPSAKRPTDRPTTTERRRWRRSGSASSACWLARCRFAPHHQLDEALRHCRHSTVLDAALPSRNMATDPWRGYDMHAIRCSRILDARQWR
jgi:hypothetical protein